MRTLQVRPWNVKEGDTITLDVLPYESATGRATFTIRFVERGRSFMTGESTWTLYADHGRDARRLGTYYRDQRVTIQRP